MTESEKTTSDVRKCWVEMSDAYQKVLNALVADVIANGWPRNTPLAHPDRSAPMPPAPDRSPPMPPRPGSEAVTKEFKQSDRAPWVPFPDPGHPDGGELNLRDVEQEDAQQMAYCLKFPPPCVDRSGDNEQYRHDSFMKRSRLYRRGYINGYDDGRKNAANLNGVLAAIVCLLALSVGGVAGWTAAQTSKLLSEKLENTKKPALIKPVNLTLGGQGGPV